MTALLLVLLATACSGGSVTVAPGNGTEPDGPATTTPDVGATATPRDPLAAPVLRLRSGTATASIRAFTYCVSGPDPSAPPGSGRGVGLCADGIPRPLAHPALELSEDREVVLELDRPWDLEGVSVARLTESGCRERGEVALIRVDDTRWRVPEPVAPGHYVLETFARGPGGDGAFAMHLIVGGPEAAGPAPAPGDDARPSYWCD